MLLFGELLEKGLLGDMRILRAHLQDRYDFAFLYTAQIEGQSIPNGPRAESLHTSGYAVLDGSTRVLQMYGFGEFKAIGDSVFADFDPSQPRKSPESIDFLVCWEFSAAQVQAYSWSVEEANAQNSDFVGQTHVWIPGGTNFQRSRPLPVCALRDLVEAAVANGELEAKPGEWPTPPLPINYF